MLLRYGAEYVLVGMVRSASSIRPRLELDTRLSDEWHTALIFAEEPGAPTPLESDERQIGGELAAALNELDSFPTLLRHGGRPVLEGGWHEEISAERRLGSRGKVQAAAFHDDNRHVAVFGRGNDLPAGDYFQDYFSNGFAYDGGASGSWGMRLALREKLSDSLEVTAVYAYAGALSPSDLADGPMRDVLRVGVRQALPKFAPGRWEAIANCDNMFAQGYVSVNTQDGRAVLVPAFRTFRG